MFCMFPSDLSGFHQCYIYASSKIKIASMKYQWNIDVPEISTSQILLISNGCVEIGNSSSMLNRYCIFVSLLNINNRVYCGFATNSLARSLRSHHHPASSKPRNITARSFAALTHLSLIVLLNSIELRLF